MSRTNAEKAVRKSIEAQLYAARETLKEAIPISFRSTAPYAAPEIFPIWWPNKSFYGSTDETKPPFYARFSHHPSQPQTWTLGLNPRMLVRGHSLIGLHIPEAMGEDLIDDLANIILEFYPHPTDANPDAGVFSRDGFDTHLESVDPKPAFGSLGRWYKPIHINWSCWRTTP